MAKLEDVEGIGNTYGAKLREAGIRSTNELLKKGETPTGRKQIAKDAGISEKLVLTWVNHVDLFRIKGVAGQYSELLEAAGVDTVVELSKRKATALHETMKQTNLKKRLVRQIPALSQIENWIEQAKSLPRAIKY